MFVCGNSYYYKRELQSYVFDYIQDINNQLQAHHPNFNLAMSDYPQQKYHIELQNCHCTSRWFYCLIY